MFIDEKQRLSFCKGLAEYIDYIKKTSPYKEAFAEQINEYEKLDIKIMELEDKTLKEMIDAKNKLLKIIKKNKIDIKTFQRLQTFGFDDTTDLIEEFDMYYDGQRAVGVGFRSDSLQNYLFDIAANLLRLGYKDELKDLLVTDKEYTAHSARINGQGSWAVGGLPRMTMTRSCKN